METFSDIFTSKAVMESFANTLGVKSLGVDAVIQPISDMEYLALVGRYGSSHIRYHNRYQFMAQFFTLYIEAQERLLSKIKINKRLRNLTEEEALTGSKIITNNATNPDTSPATDAYEPLPYVNSQSAQKERLGEVKGLYGWKHSVGGQAYIEFVDTFKQLFRIVLQEEETVYEE